MRRFAVIFAFAAVCAGVNSARAADGDEQLVTSSRAATSPNTVLAAAASTTTQTDSVQQIPLKDDSIVAPFDAAAGTRPRVNLNLIHGSAGVSIGTGGYRSAYVSAIMPVGNDALLGIAVSQTDFGKNGAFYGYGNGYGYGHGRGWGQRGGKQTSVAVALDMGDGESSPDVPAGCAPGFRDGDGRYVEPVWVTRLHGSRSCEVTIPDPSPQVSAQGQ